MLSGMPALVSSSQVWRMAVTRQFCASSNSYYIQCYNAIVHHTKLESTIQSKSVSYLGTQHVLHCLIVLNALHCIRLWCNVVYHTTSCSSVHAQVLCCGCWCILAYSYVCWLHQTVPNCCHTMFCFIWSCYILLLLMSPGALLCMLSHPDAAWFIVYASFWRFLSHTDTSFGVHGHKISCGVNKRLLQLLQAVIVLIAVHTASFALLQLLSLVLYKCHL